MRLLDLLIPPVHAGEFFLGHIDGLGPFQDTMPVGGTATTKERLGTFLSQIVTVMTVVAAIAFVLYFVLAAFKWITSGGDKNTVAEAKSQMTQSVIGLIAVVAAIFIVGLIGKVLGIDILNPGKLIGL